MHHVQFRTSGTKPVHMSGFCSTINMYGYRMKGSSYVREASRDRRTSS
jgi:hypothetical protein